MIIIILQKLWYNCTKVDFKVKTLFMFHRIASYREECNLEKNSLRYIEKNYFARSLTGALTTSATS